MTRTLALALLIIGTGMIGEAAERPAQPNIVIMMADDMGLGDTSAYLGKSLGPNAKPITRTLRTPNLEDFAKQGSTE